MTRRLQKFFSILCAITLLLTSIPSTVLSDPEIPAEPVMGESTPENSEGDNLLPADASEETSPEESNEPDEENDLKPDEDPVPETEQGQEQPSEPNPDQSKGPEETPDAEESAEVVPEGEKPAEEVPDEEKPAEEVPDEETPAEETPAEEKPAEETPDEEKPAEEIPDGEKPAEETPDGEKPAEEVPAEEKPTVEVPEGEKPAEEIPDEEKQEEENLTEEEIDEEKNQEEAEAPKLRLNETFRDTLEAGKAFELAFCPETDMDAVFTLTVSDGETVEFSFGGKILSAAETEMLETGENRYIYQAEVKAWQETQILLTASVTAGFTLTVTEKETENEQAEEQLTEVRNNEETEESQSSEDPEEKDNTPEDEKSEQSETANDNEQSENNGEDELGEEERALVESYKQLVEEAKQEKEKDEQPAEDKAEITEETDEEQPAAEEAARRAEESIELTSEEITAEALPEEETNALIAQFFAPKRTAMKLNAKKASAAAVSADQQKTGYAAFDISLANEDKTGYGSYTVPVELEAAIDLNSLKPEAREKDVYVMTNASFELYHVKENEDGSQYIENVSVTPHLDEDGILTGFDFVTDGFSAYILKYTVDFHYNGIDYSIPGESQILLSELIEQLQIKNGDTLLNVADVESVSFTDEHLVTVEQVSGLIVYNGVESVDAGEKDFLLSSIAPFSSEETLAICLNNGMVIPVGVTDAAVWYKTVHLCGRDEISLQEIMGDEYGDNYIFWAQHPSEINRTDTTLTNLSCIPYSEEGYVYIWDWDQMDYVYYLFFVQDIIYKVSEAGEIPLADVIASINVENENYYATVYGQYNSAVDYDSNNNVFTIRDVSAIPDEGVLFDVVDLSNYSYAPFGILIMPDRADEEDDGPYHDDMFWYTLVKNENGRVTEAIVDSVYEEYHGTVLEFTNRTRDGKYPVKQIKAGAFKGNTVISEIHTDNKLSGFVFDEETFEGMTSLERVSIGTSENTSGQVTVKENAFKDCSALKSFACHYSSATIEANAFTGCTALETVVFTGKDSFKISTDAFKDAVSVQYLRIDNSYDMKGGTFAIADGTAFVQNNDAPLNGNLAAKVGKFGIYVFEKNPWWMSSDAFSQASVASSIYFADPVHVTPNLISALQNAHVNLKDVYFDCMREEFQYADELDRAGVKAKVHYNDNTEIRGFYLDGVNGNDDTADGTAEKPYKTFGKLAEDWASLSVNENADPMTETDTAITTAVDSALAATGINKTAGTFITYIIREKEAFIQNTVKITGNEIWDYTGEDELVLNRDPGFKGIMVQNNGTLTLKHVVLDGGGNRGIAAEAPVIKSTGSLNIGTGAVIRNNIRTNEIYPDSAGGIYASGLVTMDGGEIRGNSGLYGGGIEISGTFNMSGGTITENTATGGTKGFGGGVLIISGGIMNLSGEAVISKNRAEYSYSYVGAGGGGIAVGGYVSGMCQQATLNMTGGTVSENYAYNNGGGISIQDNCVANISGGRITDNSCYAGLFGGGGIYVNGKREVRDGKLNLKNALIKGNTADEEGGGLAGCATSTNTVYNIDGAAIYGNTSSDGSDLYADTVLTPPSYSDYMSGYVSERMFNGALYHWTDSRTGKEVTSKQLANIRELLLGGKVTLTAHPDGHEPTTADVIITGNHAGNKGGGIGSNGSVEIGTPPPPNDVVWTPEADKVLYGRDMKEDETFTFKVYEEKDSVGDPNFWWHTYKDILVGTGSVTGAKNGQPKAISFDTIELGTVNFKQVGDRRTFFVLEDSPESPDLLAPERYLAFTVVYTVKWDEATQKEMMSAETLEVLSGRVKDGYLEYDNSFANSTPYHNAERIRSKADSTRIINYSRYTSVSARKIWDYLGENTAPADGEVVFELYADGKPTGRTITIDGKKDENPDGNKDGETEPWEARWSEVPLYRTNSTGEIYKIHDYDDDYARIEYAIMEISCKPSCYAAATQGENLTFTEQTVIYNEPHSYYYDSVTYELYADGEPTGQLITLDLTTHWQDDEDAWVAKWQNLPVYRLDEAGNLYKENESDTDFARIQYTVRLIDSVINKWTDPEDEPPTDPSVPQATSLLIPLTSMNNTVIFKNVYHATGRISLDGTKTIENRNFKAGDQWTFMVTAADGVPMPEKTLVVLEPTDGKTVPFSFGDVHYTEKDIGQTYEYTVTETGTVANVRNDVRNIRKVKVTVKDHKNGILDVQLAEDSDDLHYINTFITGDLEVIKTVVSDMEEDHSKAFRFTVTLSDTTLNGTYGGMTFTDGTATFTLTDNERLTASGLPLGITYTVAEAEDIGFTATSTGETGTITTGTAQAAFTNTRKTGGLEIIKRVTVDGEPTTGTLADGVYTFTVTRDGEAVEGSPATIRIINGTAGRAELTGLVPGIYLVREEASGNGTVLTDGNNKPVVITEEDITTIQAVTFTNNYKTPEEPKKETVDISGAKTWVDNDNQDGTRPEKITINLYADGKLTARATVTAAKNWQWTFKGLNKLDDNGREISYTISEEPVEGYTSVVNGYQVTNIASPKNGTLGILKVWEDLDDLDGSRPESVQVTLTADGTPVRTVVLNEENHWSAIVEDLPKENNGKAIVYAWKEETVAGYTSSQETQGTLTVLTNRHEPEMTEVSVRKVWDDRDNALGIRPGSVTMVLSNGTRVTLSAENSWSATVGNLPASYKGETIHYSWTELEPAGYVLENVSTLDGVTTFTNRVWERPELPELPEQENNQTEVKRPGTPLVEIDDYDTALGVEAIINHVGHCFD